MKNKSLISRLATGYMLLTDRKSKHSKKWFLSNKSSIKPHSYVRNVMIEEEAFCERPLWRIKPDQAETEATVIYLHGGAFAKNFQPMHWRFVHKLVENLNADVFAPDYPLLPMSTYAETQDYFLKLFQKISDEVAMQDVFVVADTSGATLALNALQQFRNNGIEQPKELILLSPWLDLTLSNPQIEDLALNDPVHDVDVLKELATLYANDLPGNDASLSPIYADTRRLAPITVFIGTQDLFLADCRKLKVLSESKPVVFNYREYNGMFNNWMYYDLPESKQALNHLFHHMKSAPSEFELAMQENTVAW